MGGTSSVSYTHLDVYKRQAIYHIVSIHNPQNIRGIRKERYERAVEWLKAVAAKEISVDGLPLLPEKTRAAKSNFLIKSNRKRVNHW